MEIFLFIGVKFLGRSRFCFNLYVVLNKDGLFWSFWFCGGSVEVEAGGRGVFLMLVVDVYGLD